VGSGITQWHLGDRVISMNMAAAFAEQTVANAN
jgi:NADPH:quinone reductase-like Zn-dependent oxidoreductase